MPDPELLILGHVTRDEIAGEVRLGGSAGFAAGRRRLSVCNPGW